jgi:hypothetical protein
MNQANSSRTRLLVLLLAVAALSIAALACGGDSGDGVGSETDEIIAKIDATDRIYTADDIKETPFFKTDDNYDVEGLDAAVAAVYGFYGTDPYNRKEYEARFYPDHATAMAQGVDFADEATGDASILKDIQRWDEGIKDRRQCAGNGGHHSGKCDNPKYFDYIVVGNMILMCQGKDTAESHLACSELMQVVQ